MCTEWKVWLHVNFESLIHHQSVEDLHVRTLLSLWFFIALSDQLQHQCFGLSGLAGCRRNKRNIGRKAILRNSSMISMFKEIGDQVPVGQRQFLPSLTPFSPCMLFRSINDSSFEDNCPFHSIL
jgi:hypothetical protein